MKIKTLHAHFLISTENYCNERIGFSVELENDETPELIVPLLRARAKAIVAHRDDKNGGVDKEFLQAYFDNLKAECSKYEKNLSILSADYRTKLNDADIFHLETNSNAIED